MLNDLEFLQNLIYQGDNLIWVNLLSDESIDLCYIDPPFFTQQDFGDFDDRFAGGIEHYIDWMRPRIELIHKKLKKTGSIFLHCDWHASHRLRCLLDEIFKPDNFINEIIWNYSTGGASKERFSRKHDTIFWYSKSKVYQFYPERCLEDRTEKSLARAKNPKGARITCNNTKKLPTDVWQISALNPMSNERLGYPTQKPEKLIEKIILSASNENNIILDCFGGGGTTAKVCSNLNRKFITGDVSPVACKIGMKRLNKYNFFDYEFIDVS